MSEPKTTKPIKVTVTEFIELLNEEVALLRDSKEPVNSDHRYRLADMLIAARDVIRKNSSDNNMSDAILEQLTSEDVDAFIGDGISETVVLILDRKKTMDFLDGYKRNRD